ncbi:hypothetical protein BDV26DRAFT_264426 [Aspergillus bertholletiae]|uniref:Uncharacterized protein n=1 Tax=Aspergillus bertholletiae TaxID=1226010 RepID=A0A5N7B6G9_9EURO|nr:hypothetical protein BDV26DRAFT_264426 [Aspergillus bertholletiae]
MESGYDYSRFPGFQPNPSSSATSEFARLANHMGWKPGSKTYKREWANFTQSEFSRHFGAEGKLQNWQALCQELRLDVPTASITQCRKALSRVHVNLVDLIDSRRSGTLVQQFPSLRALRKYTLDSGKIFPRTAAKKDGFLKDLLRRII